eukprot:TRINITY_DN341_c0_g1_i1.p1 TRINITY_DN341_c0_g1~~TRINITY_DN341_c0_g1_i1.p1  ORF type:complete len:262 (-),score=40.13 TRINITY_DN341_c0_g1_i1:47-805(-)
MASVRYLFCVDEHVGCVDAARLLQVFLRPTDSVVLYHAGHAPLAVQKNVREVLVTLQPYAQVVMDIQPGDNARDGIVRRSEEFDIVVLAARGKDERKRSINSGSISNFVLHNVSKPVFIARTTKHKTDRITLCIDSSPHATKALHLLCSIVHPSEEVFLWSASPQQNATLNTVQEQAKTALTARLASGEQVTSTITITNDPRTDVLRYADANNTSLIVCGTRGQGKLGRMVFGSFSTYLMENAEDFSILVVP